MKHQRDRRITAGAPIQPQATAAGGIRSQNDRSTAEALRRPCATAADGIRSQNDRSTAEAGCRPRPAAPAVRPQQAGR